MQNALLRRCWVTRGSAIAVVTATGMSTELGQVARLAAAAAPEESPLTKSLGRLSRHLIVVTLLIAAVVASTGILRGQSPMLMVEAAIALAVAAIPEGLPIVATLAVARGMWRMARKNALIERLARGTVHRCGGAFLVAAKGAPEAILALAARYAGPGADLPFDQERRAQLHAGRRGDLPARAHPRSRGRRRGG